MSLWATCSSLRAWETDPAATPATCWWRPRSPTRATLTYFMRGGENLPPTAFPDPEGLRRPSVKAITRTIPPGRLKAALAEYSEPQFHPAPTSGLDPALHR